ncbi:hypothetical protein DFH29DRAFT_819222, partial [Suillus ampliporus]
DIYKWTSTENATAPCLVRDVLSMRPNDARAPNTNFYWLGHIPCRTVLIVGVVIGIKEYEKWTLYTVDDSTGTIECMLYHPLTPKAPMNPNLTLPVQKSRWAAPLCGFRRPLPPPLPAPVTAIGYPVQVIGKVVQFHDERQIKAQSIKPCQSTNDQWKHILTVAELHKSKYAVPKPFQIPVSLIVSSPEFGTRTPLKRRLHAHESSSPLTRSTTSVASTLVIPGSTHPPKLLHPSQLRTADLTENTFRLYVKHYMDHALAAVPHWHIGEEPFSTPTKSPRIETHQARTPYAVHDPIPPPSAAPPTGPAGFTLSHLRHIPELALLAARVVYAQIRRARAEMEAKKAGQSQKSSSKSDNPHSRPRTKPSDAPRMRMKRLFMWAVLRLYEEGSIVLCDRHVPLLPRSTPMPLFDMTVCSTASVSTACDPLVTTANSTMFSSPGVSSSKTSVPKEDAYLSDSPLDEEDEAYVSVTSALLTGPVQEIMRAKGISAKSTKVGVEDITRDLRRLDMRWARITTRAVEEAVETITFN